MSSSTRNYWLDLFTLQSWQEFLDAGASVSGFNQKMTAKLDKIQVGDYLLCYVTGISRFIGILEVCSAPYQDDFPIWSSSVFPNRVKVKPVAMLKTETAIPVLDLVDELSIFKVNPQFSAAWTGYVRASPTLWKVKDGEAVTAAIMAAIENPVVKPLPKKRAIKKIAAIPPTPPAIKPTITVSTPRGIVTVPSGDENGFPEDKTSSKEQTEHTEIQYLLLQLGVGMGLSVWVASNDVNRKYKGKKLSEHFNLQKSLPQLFDEFTNKTIGFIDVLWLKGSAIVAAFEIESTTSIYSGLLRMSDLVAMQPNLSISLYIVAPDERRGKVKETINRPTFNNLPKPLVSMCRYISFTNLKAEFPSLSKHIKHLNPQFLNDLSENCSPVTTTD